ncbi:MAG: BACON domain-containing carbohydrate-binding protein, partial [Bacteroidota bacterium]
SENANWLGCSPTTGTNDDFFRIEYLANTGSSPRSAEITVYGGGISTTVYITQLGTGNSLSVSQGAFSANENSGHFDIGVTSNVAWTVSEGCDWVICDPVFGTNNQPFGVTYDQNNSTSARTCTITVSGGGLTEYVVLTQAGMQPYINVSQNVYNVNPSQGNVYPTVTSNIWWTVDKNCDWVSCMPLSGSNINLTIGYSANTTGNSRSCILTISGQGAAETITITQEAVALYLYATPEIISLGSGLNNSGHVNISSNTAWNITKRPAWINSPVESGDPDVGFDIYTAEQNSMPVSRTGVITISSLAGSTDVVVVQQAMGVEDMNLSRMVTVYPNPAQKLIYIQSVSSEPGLMNIDVYGPGGALISRYRSVSISKQPFALNISEMTAGSYLIKIYNNDRFCIRKVIKTD